jgi:YD repeat-containing protein
MAQGEGCGGREGHADAFQRLIHSVHLLRAAGAARTCLRAQMGRLLGFATLFVVSLFLAAPVYADVSYTYDDLGRIKSVHSASGEVAEYVYDAVGNILQVRRVGIGQLAVTGFDPVSGAVGTSVTIDGSGFSATAASNTVRFNGVTAAVTSATTTSLTATVPAGAATGPISVAVGANTATSLSPFTVVFGAGRLPPTIVDFTPKIGPAGTSVTVTGTNFDTAAGATRVSLGGTLATSSVASASSLSMTVPARTGSGTIQVSTAAGTATSLVDFIVPPPGIPQASIAASVRANAGQTATVALPAQYKYGLVLVEGYQGSYVSLDLTTFTVIPSTATIAYTVYAPDNTVFVTGKTVSATDRSIHLPVFPRSGKYTVAFYSGAATATIGVQTLSISSVAPGNARAVSTTFAGQSVRVSYPGSAGESLGLEVAGMSTTPAGQPVAVTMFAPDGTLFRSLTTSTVGGFLQLPVLPVAGTYTVVIDPAGTDTTALQLTLERGTPLTVNGAPVNAPLAIAGEAARFVYNAPVNLPVQVNINSEQLGSSKPTVTMYNATGTSLGTTYCSVGSCAIILANQPSAGPFSIIVQPYPEAAGSVSASVTSSDGVGALGYGKPLSIVVGAGRSAYYTFTASAGESPSVNLAFAPNSGYSNYVGNPHYIKVYKPDGTLLIDGPVSGTGVQCNASSSTSATVCSVQLAALPVSGTYTVVVQPYIVSGTVTVTATLQREAVVTNPAPGTPVANILSPSQELKITFTANAGESPSVFLQFAPNVGYWDTSTTPRYIKVYKPDGTLLTDGPIYAGIPTGIKCNGAGTGALGSVMATACTVQLTNLPTSGTYTVVVQPYIVSGTVTVTATLQRQTTSTVSVGSPQSSALAPSQNAVFNFSATVGSSPTLTLAFSPSSGYAGSSTLTPRYIKVYRPDGTQLLDGPIYGSTTGITCNGGAAVSTSCTVLMSSLPATGAYKVLVQPYITSGTVNVTATLSGI